MRRSQSFRRTRPTAGESSELQPNYDRSPTNDHIFEVETIHPSPASLTPLDGHVRGQKGPRHKDVVLSEYGAKLTGVKSVALITFVLHRSNRFLGLCALTWASVVVLGGFFSQLGKGDFYSVSTLLFLETVRLVTARFFGNAITPSPNPTKLGYDYYRRQMIVAVVRVVDLAFQLMLVAISFILPTRRLRNLVNEDEQDQFKPFDGLRHSLRIFYFLVLLDAIVATISVIHSKTIAPFFVTSYSLHRYYANVVWTDIYGPKELKELDHASDFDFVTFAFKTQSDEYRRLIRPAVVGALYKDLIAYLFAHPKGFEAAHNALNSADTYEQEAAANIVGLWAELDQERRVLRLQRRLLSRLADMVDNQGTGLAATSSFERLAKFDREGVLEVRNENGTYLIDILINRVHEVVRGGMYDSALIYVKALVPLLLCKGESERSPVNLSSVQGRTLVRAMWTVFRSNSRFCLKRTKAVVGYALRTLTNNKEPTEGDVNMYLRNQPLERGEYIMEEENKYLVELLGGSDRVPVAWWEVSSPYKLEILNVQVAEA